MRKYVNISIFCDLFSCLSVCAWGVILILIIRVYQENIIYENVSLFYKIKNVLIH